ncbi:MAG: exonuclease domain-containing protein [Wenzhouxiangella sp.]|nr:exonuclease domain-containing protein [Wenzhouxiangella sp.]
MRAMTWQLWVTLGAIAVVCLLWLVAAATLLWAVLDPGDVHTIVTAMDGRWGLLVFLWAISLVPIYSALHWAMNRYLAEPERLADAVDVRLKQHRDDPIAPVGTPAVDRLASMFNDLLARERTFNDTLAREIEQATQHTETERAWLSTLLAELNRSVIVTNREGQILLYNQRARLQFKRLADAEDLSHGGELIGLGRAIDTIIDPELITHAKSTIERRLKRGDRQTSTQCLMQTPKGRTYRILVSPVCRQDATAPATLDGMMLVIDNITDEVQLKQQHTESLQALAHDASAQADALADIQRQLNTTQAQALHAQLGEIGAAIGALAQRLATLPKRTLKPFPLEDLSAQDWIDAIQHARKDVPNGSDRVTIQVPTPLTGVWLRVDGLSLVRAVVALLDALNDHPATRAVTVTIGFDDDKLLVDIDWLCGDGQGSTDRSVHDWFHALVDQPALGANAVGQTIAEVLAYHGGHGSVDGHRLALHLPRIPPTQTQPDTPAPRVAGRPETHDFHLFDAAIASIPEAQSPLSALSFTVFDTETTGLSPSRGDEIIQLGAVRVVNGRILSQECFDQLIDPKRPIPATSTAIHGIEASDVKGQPDIHTVLPIFHRFCQGTVLVAHNADFDLQCLALKAPACGLAFDHPVLDTLLLSALAHPYQDSHNLDDLAARFGVRVQHRHRALGDAQMTAEVLVKLMPILKERGITTLEQALQAQRSVWQKRASY